MWKCNRSFKAIFCKSQCSNNNVTTTRASRNDTSSDYFLKFSPTVLGYFSRFYAQQKRNSCGQFGKSEKEDPKTEKGYCLNDFQDGFFGALRLSGVFVLGWYILHPFAYKKAVINPQSSDKCTFRILSKYTQIECQKLLTYLDSNPNVFNTILPEVQAKKGKKLKIIDDEKEDQSEEEEIDVNLLEKARNRVLGTLSHYKGAKCWESGKYSEAYQHFEEGALVNNPAAIFNLGICHELGLGTSQSFKKAAELYRKASDLGHPTAMYNLAIYYVNGWGDLQQDDSKARKLFESAASLGQVNAKKALGLDTDKSSVKPVTSDKFPKSAKKTDKNAWEKPETYSFTFSRKPVSKPKNLDVSLSYIQKELDSKSSNDSGALDLSPVQSQIQVSL